MLSTVANSLADTPAIASCRRLLLLVFSLALLAPQAQGAELRVIISGGFFAAYSELLPQFESGRAVSVETGRGGSVGDNPRAIPNQIRRGVPADVVILARQGLNQLIDEGLIEPDSAVDLADSMIGLVVQSGAPRPTIDSPGALREVLLNAASVAVSSSTSGQYLTTELFPRLGIAAELAAKTQRSGAAAVGRGEAEIGLQQVSELLPIEGADFVGTIPAELQFVTTYAAAIVHDAANPELAAELIDFLSGEEAADAVATSGLQPALRRQ